MKITSRASIIAMSFLFSLGCGVAFAASNTACLNACNADVQDCLSDKVGSAKASCITQLKLCKKSCNA